jgi:hypothetical protein
MQQVPHEIKIVNRVLYIVIKLWENEQQELLRASSVYVSYFSMACFVQTTFWPQPAAADRLVKVASAHQLAMPYKADVENKRIIACFIPNPNGLLLTL